MCYCMFLHNERLRNARGKVQKCVRVLRKCVRAAREEYGAHARQNLNSFTLELSAHSRENRCPAEGVQCVWETRYGARQTGNSLISPISL